MGRGSMGRGASGRGARNGGRGGRRNRHDKRGNNNQHSTSKQRRRKRGQIRKGRSNKTVLNKSRREEKEIAGLDKRIADMTTALENAGEKAASGEAPLTFATFEDFPLSTLTQEGLKKHGFTVPTAIQCSAIPLALSGKDVLGAAKTGSGKTLAFLIPALETLFRGRFSSGEGLGAIVISPTRELALQIFDVLRLVGERHDFAAGLIIGGKSFSEEQRAIHRMNFLISTPGRLLHHFEHTPGFSGDDVKLLVLDEADRILDMGFQRELTAILTYLPPTSVRQTLLFSATQTKSVSQLARLSLSDPAYVAVHERSDHATPEGLDQLYISCPLDRKLDVLFYFIKTHLKSKVLVFLSTCKQVKFVHEIFSKLRPGVPLMALHGKIRLMKRLAIYSEFVDKHRAVMFATDVAARGLHFPDVDWVLQVDCPEGKDNYIHRVGRTARYKAAGHSLLFLLPSEEEAMVEELTAAKVPMQHTEVNPSKQVRLGDRFQSMIAENPELKLLAQKAFVSYVRSVCLQPNKKVFQATALPLADLAESYGLSSAPRVRFLEKMQNREELKRQRMEKMEQEKALQFARNMEAAMAAASPSADSATPAPKQTLSKRVTRKNKTRERQLFAGETQVAESRAVLAPLDNLSDDASDAKEELLVPKSEESQRARRAWLDGDISDDPEQDESLQRKRLARKLMRNLKRSSSNAGSNKIVFDTDGNVVKQSFADLAQVRAGAGGKEKISDFTKKMAQQIRQADALDREAHKQRVRSKRRRQKERQREEDEYSSASSSSSGDEAGGGSSYGRVTLGRPDDSDDDDGVGGMDDGDERMFSESSTKRGSPSATALSASTELTEEPTKSRKKRARAKESKPSVKTHQKPAQKKKKKKKVKKIKKIKKIKKGKEAKKAPTSIAEAEKLVLQLIGGE